MNTNNIIGDVNAAVEQIEYLNEVIERINETLQGCYPKSKWHKVTDAFMLSMIEDAEKQKADVQEEIRRLKVLYNQATITDY